MKIEKKTTYFKGTSSNVSATYDLHDPVERKAAIRIIIAFFLPLIIFIVPAVYMILNENSILIPVILIITGVMGTMIFSTSALIYNKAHQEEVDEHEVESAKVIRSIMIIIFLCVTYIPFLPYIASLIFAKKYPNGEFYQKGFNAQTFTLLWSIISLISFIIGLILYNAIN